MAYNISNVKVVPCAVIFDDEDLGLTDGDVEISVEEKGVEIMGHQEGTNVLDMIRTGKNVSIALTLKETSVAQLTALLTKGGGTAASVAAITNITCVADVAGSLNNKYFFINSAGNLAKYMVWFNVNSEGVEPTLPSGYTGVEVALATDAAATAVADAVATALDNLAAFVAPNPAGAVVACTNAAVGLVDSPAVGNSGFTIVVATPGGAALPGWGNSKDFTSMLGDAAKLVLHPTVKDDDDFSEDTAFWKAYPVLSSIVKSGENPQTVAVEFKIFPDTSKPDEIRLFCYGDHT